MAGEHVRRRQKQATGSQSYITEVQRTKKTSRTRVTKGGRREGLLDIIVVALLLQLKYQGVRQKERRKQSLSVQVTSGR